MTFNYNNRFRKAIKKQVGQARTKVLFSMLNRARNLGLSIEIQLEYFDHLVVPILIYGSEVWGHEDIYLIESYQVSEEAKRLRG